MKGSILDVLFVIAVVFVITVGLIFGGLISSKIQEKLNSSSAFTPADINRTNALFNKGNEGLGVLDYMILGVLIFLSLGMIISAFWIKTHPAFFVIFLVIQIFVIFVSNVITEVYNRLAADPLLAPFANQYTTSRTIMQNLPFFTLIISSLVAIVMYGKSAGATYEM
jgi:hypothetical protein